MTNSRVVKRYASALYAVAAKTDQIDKVAEDLGLIRSTLDAYPQLKSAIMNSVTPDDKKVAVLTKLFGDKTADVTIQFLKLVVEKRREDTLETIDRAFQKISDERRGMARAEVVSAVPLTDAELVRVKSSLADFTGKTVEVDTSVDPSILGGLVIRLGDRLLDGSVRGELLQIKKALAGAV